MTRAARDPIKGFERGLTRLLETGRSHKAYPQASAWVAHDGHFVGQASIGGASERTRFDVASLTKPMAVVTLAMRGVSQGWLDLETPIAADLPSTLTPYTLLGHRAGLPAWRDLVAALPAPRHPGSAEARYAVRALVRQAAREADPSRGVEYSDLGFILLGQSIEELTGISLDRHVTVGSYRGTRPARGGDFASTGACPWRERELVGEVHDPNAWVMGGVAGHAGLFATAGEVGRWALGLERLAAEDHPFEAIDAGVLRAFWDPGQRTGSGTWVVGWDTPSPAGSSAGTRVSELAVGHLGFTGTSIWIDRATRLVIVLLTNRVALGAAAQARLKAFRPGFHDSVRQLLSI